MNDLPHRAASIPFAAVRAMVARASYVTFACAMLVAGPAAAQVAPLLNGGFEGPPQTTGYTTVSGYLSGATGWKVTAGNVNVGTAPAGTACQGGGHCVDLNGNSQGRIEQTMASKAGSKCTVTFWMSRHLQRTSATLQTFVNNVATSPGTFTHNVVGISPTDGKWEQHSFSFASADPATTIAFASAMTGAAGPQVDNVRMSCTSPSGSLSVKKVVINNVGPTAPIPSTFDTTTHCSANVASPAVNTPVAVAGGQTVLQPGTLQAGTICSVTEAPPAPIKPLEACKGRGATWTVSYSAPVTIVAGANAVLTVTNTLDCDKPTGGTLQVHKSVVNTLGVPTPPSFNMTASCGGMAAVPLVVPVDGTVTVPPGGLIPDGTVCTITETIPPKVTGVKACPSGTATWVPSNPGPLTVHTAQTTGTIITNTLTCDKPPESARFQIRKSTGAAVIPGTYVFNLSCTVGGTTVPVTSPVSIALPGTGFTTISVPGGASCVVTEQSPGTNWNPSPAFVGSGGLTVIPGGGLLATVGPVTGTSGVVTVMNERKPDSAGCPDRTQSSLGCRATVTMKRTKGPATYSVIPSQAATYPMSNTLPSTGAACVIAGNAMINQTTCWFNYSASSTTLTLSTASSAGPAPLANWSGDCTAVNSSTCTLPAVTQTTPRSVVVTFP